ncbi:MAG: glycosyltransferase [Ignavibacteria bacterium]|nr:glycosyltransferase [Ignavibacteria bacterium]
MNSKVNIIIPTYNRKFLLEKTINSILQQTYTNYEIIVVDDGSNDGTADVLNKFTSANLKYHFSENSKNIARLRNIGIMLSDGELIAFCDDDDVWDPDKLMQAIGYIKNYDVVCSNARIIDVKDNIKQERYFWEYYKDTVLTPKELLKYNCILTPTVVLKKDILLQEGLFDETNFSNHLEDYDLWLRIIKKVNICMIGKELVSIRIHDRNTTNDYSLRESILCKSIQLIENFNYASKKRYNFSVKVGVTRYYLGMIQLNISKVNSRFFSYFTKFIIHFFDPRICFYFLYRNVRKLYLQTVSKRI